MPNLLAIDWDKHELRYVLASVAGRKITVRAVGAIPVADADAENADEWCASLAKMLKKHRVRHPRLLVGLPRRDVELLNLELPPATDEELPELVANLAMRESSSLADDALLDFVPLDSDVSAPRHVIAAALNRSEYEQMLERMAVASLKPRRIVLRSFASASLFRRMDGGGDDVCLLVNRVGAEVNLNVLDGDRIVYTRSVRIPDGAGQADVNQRVTTEVVRTLTVAPLDCPSLNTIARVGILGSTDEYAELVEALTTNHELEVVSIDPFTRMGVPESLLPEDRGRYAPLLGMLLDEAAGSHAIDFLQPRRVPRSVSRLRVGLIAAGAVAAVALAIAVQVWMTLGDINSHNAQLALRLKDLDATMKKVAVQQKAISAVAAWQTSDVNWLDELRDLSIRFPSPRDAVVLRMSLRSSSRGGGEIDFNGLVRDPKIVVNLEYLLRDEFRQVRSDRVQQRSPDGDYTSQFQTRIRTSRRSKDQYISHLPPPEPVSPKDPLRVASGEPGDPQEVKP